MNEYLAMMDTDLSNNKKIYASEFICKNLVDINNVSVLKGYGLNNIGFFVRSDQLTYIIPIEQDTKTYTFSFISGVASGYYALADEIPTGTTSSHYGRTAYLINNGKWYGTFTNQNHKYLLVGVQIGKEAEYFQLEPGPSATDYTPHVDYENNEIYSTNEVRIGTWIDGKPLYRRVVTATPNVAQTSTSGSFDIDIANVEQVFIKDLTKVADTSTSGYVFTFPFVNGTSSMFIGGYISVLTNKLTFNIRKTNNVRFYAIRLVLEYTKTTD